MSSSPPWPSYFLVWGLRTGEGERLRFWREARVVQQAGLSWRAAWQELKTKHTLLRVLYQQFDELDHDPASMLTGAQKADLLAFNLLMEMFISASSSSPSSSL